MTNTSCRGGLSTGLLYSGSMSLTIRGRARLDRYFCQNNFIPEHIQGKPRSSNVTEDGIISYHRICNLDIHVSIVVIINSNRI